jgi:mRNA interferase MazF
LDGVKRGDLLTVAAQGDYGKPGRPWSFSPTGSRRTDSLLACLLTTTLRDAPMHRLTVQLNATNGLRAVSQIMVDKVFASRRDKCGPVFGHLEQDTMMALNRMLALVLGMAD